MQQADIISRYLALIDRIHRKYISEVPEDRLLEFEQNLLGLRRGIRWYQISTDAQVDDIWGSIRALNDNEVLLDYVIMGTAELLLCGKNHAQEWNNLRGQLTESLVWVTSDPHIDEAITTRGPDPEWLSKRFEASPWLLFLALHHFVNQVQS